MNICKHQHSLTQQVMAKTCYVVGFYSEGQEGCSLEGLCKSGKILSLSSDKTLVRKQVTF